jgi:hypothetical protein
LSRRAAEAHRIFLAARPASADDGQAHDQAPQDLCARFSVAASRQNRE